MKRVKIVFSEWMEVIDRIFGRTRSSQGHLPFGALGKHSLHINAEMNCSLSGRAAAQFVVL
jgi:hypothetical protein